MESTLSTSLDEAELTGAAGTVGPCEDHASSDPEASSTNTPLDPDSSSEPDAPFESAADQDGLLDSVRSSSDRGK